MVTLASIDVEFVVMPRIVLSIFAHVRWYVVFSVACYLTLPFVRMSPQVMYAYIWTFVHA